MTSLKNTALIFLEIFLIQFFTVQVELWRHHFLHLHNKKRKCLLNGKDIPKRKTPFFFTLKSLSNRQQLFFYFIGTLNRTTRDDTTRHVTTQRRKIFVISSGAKTRLRKCFRLLPSVSLTKLRDLHVTLFLADTRKHVRLLYDFGSPKECKRARHQKGVSIFLFGRNSSDFVVYVIKTERKLEAAVFYSFLLMNRKNRFFRYLLRVFTVT